MFLRFILIFINLCLSYCVINNDELIIVAIDVTPTVAPIVLIGVSTDITPTVAPTAAPVASVITADKDIVCDLIWSTNILTTDNMNTEICKNIDASIAKCTTKNRFDYLDLSGLELTGMCIIILIFLFIYSYISYIYICFHRNTSYFYW